VDQPLRTAAAPHGIISFELARTVQAAQSMLASWDWLARVYAGLSLGLDYLYLVVYSTAIAFGCVWIAARNRTRRPRFARAGIAIAWSQWAAALFDAVENAALFRVLTGSIAEHWPMLAWGCASLKFFLVAIGLLFTIAGAFVR
jgi:hypothetical protein